MFAELLGGMRSLMKPTIGTKGLLGVDELTLDTTTIRISQAASMALHAVPLRLSHLVPLGCHSSPATLEMW